MCKLNIVNRDPSVKRSICPKCNIVLVPGHTVRVRVKGESLAGLLLQDAHPTLRFFYTWASRHIQLPGVRWLANNTGSSLIRDFFTTRCNSGRHRRTRFKAEPTNTNRQPAAAAAAEKYQKADRLTSCSILYTRRWAYRLRRECEGGRSQRRRRWYFCYLKKRWKGGNMHYYPV